MKKKNLILIVRRSYIEIEYILPVLFKLKKRFNLSTFFLNNNSYQSLRREKKIYQLWNSLNVNYYVYSLKDNFFLRSSRYLFKNIFRSTIKLKLFYEKKLHSYNFILDKLNLKKENTNLVFGDYNNFNTWFKNIFYYNTKYRPIIIHYPSSPIIVEKKINTEQKIHNNSLYCDLLFINNQREKKYWSQFISSDKIFTSGVPIFNKEWVNKLYPKNNFYNKKKVITYAYSSWRNISLKQENKFKKQLKSVFLILSKIKNIQVQFKVHPTKNNPYFKEVLKYFKNNFWRYDNSNLFQLVKNSDVLLVTSKAPSGAILYANLFNIPVINLNSGNISNLAKKLSKNVNSAPKFKKYIYLAIKRPNFHEWIKQRKYFKKFYNLNNYSISNYLRLINIALRDKKND